MGGWFVILVGLWHLVVLGIVFVVYRFASLFAIGLFLYPVGCGWVCGCMMCWFVLCVGVGRFMTVVLNDYLIWV